MNLPEELISRIAMTPAEKMVLIEQCETLMLAVNQLKTAVEQGSNEGMLLGFYDIVQGHDYIGHLIHQKVEAAAYAITQEQRSK